MAHDFQANTLTGGLDLDTDKRLVSSNKMTDALDAEFMAPEAGKIASSEPMKGTILKYTVPSVTQQYQINRMIFNGAGAYSFVFGFAPSTIVSFALPPLSTFSDFVTAFNTNFTGAFGSVYSYTFYLSNPAIGEPYILSVYNASGSVLSYDLTYKIDGVQNPALCIQDGIKATALLPIADCNIQNYQFVFSVGVSQTCQEIGIAQEINGTFTYTRLLRTNQLNWNPNSVFDIRVENQANEYFGIYWTDFNNKPKVAYCPLNYSEDCMLKYTQGSYLIASKGLYALNVIQQQTNLQLINNTNRVQYSNQYQSGGNLISGGYRYAVRSGISGTDNVTEWSYLSNLIPVFKTSIDAVNAGIKIQGDISGTTTGKVNVLQVDGAQADVFDFIELAAIYYAGGATSAVLVKRQAITTDSFTITHSGFEAETTQLDVASLPSVEEIILQAESLEIKKNRLNLANCNVAITDSDLEQLSKDITITIDRKELDNCGKLGALNIGSGDVYAKQGSDTTYFVGATTVAPIAFSNAVVNTSPPQYNTGTYVFTADGAYAKTTIQSFVKLTVVGDAAGYRYGKLFFSVYKNGVSIKDTDAITIDSNNIYNLNIGDLLGGVDGKYSFNTSGGDTIQLIMNYNKLSFPLYSDNLVKVFTDVSYVSYYNGDATIVSPTINIKTGEYQIPKNVAKYTGYMINETYPFYVKYHMNDGSISKGFYIDSKNFTYTTSGHIFTSDYTDNRKVYAYYPKFGNIPADVLKNMGVIGISIWRGVCNPTVLGTGVSLTGSRVIDKVLTFGYYAGVPKTNGYYYSQFGNTSPLRQYGIFYSPDIHIAKTQYADGDRLNVFGQPFVYNSDHSSNTVVYNDGGSPINCLGSYAEFSGVANYISPQNKVVDDGQYVNFDENTGVSMGGENYIPSTEWGLYKTAGSGAEGFAFHITSKITTDGTQDNGVYLSQYIRSVLQQYEPISTPIVPTGTYIDIESNMSSTINDVQVFGGDTYTQKTYMKIMYGSSDENTSTTNRYSFISYYGQNRVNTQLFYTDKSQPQESWNIWACQKLNDYLFPKLVSDSNPQEQFNYDKGYDAPNVINIDTPYDPSIQVNSHFGSRIWYSNQKPTGSVYDFYRKINPLDFKDLDNKYGDICALYDINDTMVAWQPNAVSVLPYQSDVALSGANGTDIYVGQGSVYAQRERIVSAYGTSIKTAVLRGQNANGNYNAYWYSNLFKKMMRYGSGDGVKIISDLNNVRSWFLNNTAHITQNWDIVLGYQVNKESLYITSRAIKKGIPVWSSSTTYPADVYVTYVEPDKTHTFELIPNVYESLYGSNLAHNPYQDTAHWSYVDSSTKEFYNLWTLVFNERANAFTSFASFLPARYFQYEGRLLCPNPRATDVAYGEVDELFVNDNYLKYFGKGLVGTNPKQGTFTIEITTNKNGLAPKRMIATSLAVGTNHDTANNPLLRVYNDSQFSNIQPSEFELRMGNLAGAVRDDGDGKVLIGEWFSYKITTQGFMRLLGFLNTFYAKYRTPFR